MKYERYALLSDDHPVEPVNRSYRIELTHNLRGDPAALPSDGESQTMAVSTAVRHEHSSKVIRGSA